MSSVVDCSIFSRAHAHAKTKRLLHDDAHAQRHKHTFMCVCVFAFNCNLFSVTQIAQCKAWLQSQRARARARAGATSYNSEQHMSPVAPEPSECNGDRFIFHSSCTTYLCVMSIVAWCVESFVSYHTQTALLHVYSTGECRLCICSDGLRLFLSKKMQPQKAAMLAAETPSLCSAPLPLAVAYLRSSRRHSLPRKARDSEQAGQGVRVQGRGARMHQYNTK